MKTVTLITPTWGRPKTILKHAIPSVARQTYPEIEHIIIPDGYDPGLNKILMAEGYFPGGDRRRLVWLGRNWSGFINNDGMGDVARLVGSYLAAGDYVGYLDDDNDLREDHVEKLVELLERDGSDIAMCPWDEWPDPAHHIADANSFLHRRELLKAGSWDVRAGRTADSQLVNRWIGEGASWSFHREWTVTLNRHHGGHGAPDTEDEG
jgi:glycosyltransferase involved in cell wall biosynthesis